MCFVYLFSVDMLLCVCLFCNVCVLWCALFVYLFPDRLILCVMCFAIDVYFVFCDRVCVIVWLLVYLFAISACVCLFVFVVYDVVYLFVSLA